MNIVTELIDNKYILGSLCKRGHDWNSTGQSLRYAYGYHSCVSCQKIHSKEYTKQLNAKAKKERQEKRIVSRNGEGIEVKIYGLFTQKGNCFYVGRTSQSLKVRLKDHIFASKGSKCARAKMILDIISKGEKPVIKELFSKKCITRKEIEELEQEWINWMSIQHNLTNEVSGKQGAVLGEYGREIPTEVIDLMGKIPDPEIAKMLNCTSSNAGVIRRNMGIEPFNNYHEWTDEEIMLLGTDSDPVIANILGITRGMVQKKRQDMGIDPVPQFPYEWTPELIARLGTVPDSVIAKELGMNYWTAVQKKRKSLGIPSFRETKRKAIG